MCIQRQYIFLNNWPPKKKLRTEEATLKNVSVYWKLLQSFVPWSNFFSISAPLSFIGHQHSCFHLLVVISLFSHCTALSFFPTCPAALSLYLQVLWNTTTNCLSAGFPSSFYSYSCLPFPSLQSSPTSDCLLVGMQAPDPHCAFLPVSTLFFHLPLHHFLSLNLFSLSCHPLFSITTRYKESRRGLGQLGA